MPAGSQKTLKELTEPVTIKAVVKEKVEVVQDVLVADSVEDNLEVPSKKVSKGSGIVVYEDNSVKAKKLIPYFIGLAFGLLCLVLIRKS